MSKQIGGLSGIIGKAATDSEFRKKFLEDPKGVAKSFGLSEEQLEKLASIDIEDLKKALSGFGRINMDEVISHSSQHSSVHSSVPS